MRVAILCWTARPRYPILTGVLIEVLIVGVILSYLYTAGFLSFGSPYAVAVSVGIMLAALVVGVLLGHYAARRIVDSLFGLDAWSPRKGRKPSLAADHLRDLGTADPAARLAALKRMAAEVPGDSEVSRMLAEAHLAAGDTDAFLAEKKRLLEKGRLRKEERCAAFHRMADAELARGRVKHAVEFLRMIGEEFPDSPDSQNAEKRIAVIQGRAENREDRL